MAGNTFGKIFRLVTFGESHGKAVGGIVEGCPAGLVVDMEFISQELNRRRPGRWPGSSTRNEPDNVEFLSGILDGVTLGTPIGFIIRTSDARPEDYTAMKDAFRPGHADLSFLKKYGVRDYRGGGRASGRETVARVVGGALAKLFLARQAIKILAHTATIGEVRLNHDMPAPDPKTIEKSPTGCPDEETSSKMLGLLQEIENKGETVGCSVACKVTGLPAGLGEPVFDKLQADLAKAMLSIGGAKGFEYGAGFGASAMLGSVHTDHYISRDGGLTTMENIAGGIAGGISTGEDIIFRVAFKPVSSPAGVKRAVREDGTPALQPATGRYDTCLVPRVLPVVEAMTALVLADHLLRDLSSRVG